MIKASQFRKDLTRIMPGYKWTVHRSAIYGFALNEKPIHLTATGTQSSGFNRMSTLEITVRKKSGKYEYTSKSSGFGKNSQWLLEYSGKTLAQSLRGLQDDYEITGNDYLRHAADLQGARQSKKRANEQEE